jgi:hypothetical protein
MTHPEETRTHFCTIEDTFVSGAVRIEFTYVYLRKTTWHVRANIIGASQYAEVCIYDQQVESKDFVEMMASTRAEVCAMFQSWIGVVAYKGMR